jgi:undecaprenyl-diphosphatase
MTLFYAIVLGVIEGVTEFLPISSTAHMILASRAMHLAETEFLKSFEIIIQLGAILSVVVLYWRKFLSIEVIKKLIVAFIPTGIVGLTVYKALKTYLLGNMTVVLLSLIIGGIALILYERFQPMRDTEEIDFTEITYRKALLIGLFQSLAIVPGVSRSAATIVGGSFIGISKRTIVEFSFMLAVPTMMAATVLELVKSPALNGNYGVLAAGFIVSFITAIFAIKSFLSFIKTRSFAAFGWYRIVLAVVFFLVFLR